MNEADSDKRKSLTQYICYKNKANGRDFFRGYRKIYIFQDRIVMFS